MRVAHFRQEFSTSSETFIYDYVSEMQRQGVDTQGDASAGQRGIRVRQAKVGPASEALW